MQKSRACVGYDIIILIKIKRYTIYAGKRHKHRTVSLLVHVISSATSPHGYGPIDAGAPATRGPARRRPSAHPPACPQRRAATKSPPAAVQAC